METVKLYPQTKDIMLLQFLRYGTDKNVLLYLYKIGAKCKNMFEIYVKENINNNLSTFIIKNDLENFIKYV